MVLQEGKLLRVKFYSDQDCEGNGMKRNDAERIRRAISRTSIMTVGTSRPERYAYPRMVGRSSRLELVT